MRRASKLLVLVVLAWGCGAPDADPLAGLSSEARAGRQVFLEHSRPTCARCHTLRNAGSAGRLGPDLDERKPSSERVETVVQRGIGLMPSQKRVLTPEQIRQVATYVSEVAGREPSLDRAPREARGG